MLHEFMETLAANSPIEVLPEIVAFLAASALIAYVCNRFGLVPIVGFLLAGVAIGPNALGLVQNQDLIEDAAEIGVVLLLFTIGIEFSLEKLARISRLIFVGGGVQGALVIAIVTLLLLAFGVSWQVGIFTGGLVLLSSTVIVLKMLGDQGETNSPAGQISLGILIFQDLAAIVLVLLVPILGGAGGGPLDIVWALGSAVAIIVLVIVIARRIMPPVLERVARTCSNEIFLLTVIAICFGTAWLTSLAGVSLSLGAFLAGLIVSESRFSQYAFSEILPLQILFSATFFVSVGLLLDIRFLFEEFALVVGALLAIAVIKIVASAVTVRLLGYPLHTALLVSFLLIQVGEFAFVLEREGRAVGLVPAGLETMGGQLFIAASVVLMVATPFLAQVGYRIEDWLLQRDQAAATLEVTQEQPDAPDGSAFAHLEDHVIVAGYGEGGRQLVRVLRSSQIPYVIVTLSPAGAQEAEEEGLPVLRGDDTRLYTLQLLNIERAKMLVIADDDPATAYRIAAVARVANPTIEIVVRTRYIAEVEPLNAVGADLVIAEEMESTAQLFAQVLSSYQLEQQEIDSYIESMRANGYAVLRETAPDSADGETPIVRDLGGDALHQRKVKIRPGSPAVGQTLEQLALEEQYGVQVVAVKREGQLITEPPDSLYVQVNDYLVLVGNAESFARIAILFRGGKQPTNGATESEEITMATGRCTHTSYIQPLPSYEYVCEECVKQGDRWVHLRICRTCGYVGCCDSSKNKHATKHYRETGHPIAQSIEPGETWGWCYVDEVLFPNLPTGNVAESSDQQP